MSNFETTIKKIRAEADSTAELGNSFERLIKNYLLTDPVYCFVDAWLWSEFPQRDQLGSIDLGIDIVALNRHKEFCAVQCKFYQPDFDVTLDQVSHFIAASSNYFFVDGEKKFFTQRLWFQTTRRSWSRNISAVTEKLPVPIVRIGLDELELKAVDWAKLERGIVGPQARVKNFVRPHQKEAVDNAVEYYKTHERGKLIMACGTGKTFTSLKITEALLRPSKTKKSAASIDPNDPIDPNAPRGLVLYLTPSISLLNQTLIEWTAQSEVQINAVCVCSDETASRTNDDISDEEPILPSTTDPDKIAERLIPDSFNVIFSTYQSLDRVADAQKLFDRDFDLIICDEAHRTSGFEASDREAPLFKRVHDNEYVRAKKRMYMTATPKLFKTEAKRSADEKDLTLWSMDDETIFGEDFYVLRFSDALDLKLLTDYRVLVFTVREEDVPESIAENLTASDRAKIFGCISALSKRLERNSAYIRFNDPKPMRSAVAYCSSIQASKNVTRAFNDINADLDSDSGLIKIGAEHVDGTMRSDARKQKLALLKNVEEGRCEVLTNARCLSEGIDVPALDAVIFLSARKSQVDIIQAVGRVMRTAFGKKFGYVILPVVIPRGADPVDELNHNKQFDVIWQVLNALRAHDDKFYIEVNKLELSNNDHVLNKGKLVVSISEPLKPLEHQMILQFEGYLKEIVARIVEKVGDRQYWATWGRDVAAIAERHKAHILKLISVEGKHRNAFDEFLSGLRRNINPSVSNEEAVDMLAQHLITRPVFEALFENYNFMEQNAVSRAMQNILRLLDDQSTQKENAALERLYKFVRERCEKIESHAERQRIIIELYDKFFKVALHKTVEKLGIVYTPVEVVDFILKSVDAVLRAQFGRSLSGAGVHILDPFAGTGTFLSRLIELGLLDGALEQKYQTELHANEIVLLAYYIAAINIENAFHARLKTDRYTPFKRICLTDTFQQAERDPEIVLSGFMLENTIAIEEQTDADIEVIVGNPPYSVGQRSANDNAQNQKYARLEERIEKTYVKRTKATLKRNLYDSYVKAFRWASDRIGESGVIGFVTNAGWLDSAAFDGFRSCLEEEFTSIYVFNLRGNQRTQGEFSRREGGKIFDSGSRAPIAITILVRNPALDRKAEIHYVDIGDYLNRNEKLAKITALGNCLGESFRAEEKIIEPTSQHDWINQRGELFDMFLNIEPEKKFDESARSFFNTFSLGIATNRDAWAYNFSRVAVEENMKRTITFYNKEREAFAADKTHELDRDSTKISWTRSTRNNAKRGTVIEFDDDRIVESMYRPFCRQNFYFDRKMNEMTLLMPKFFPTGREKNLMICVTGQGSGKYFSALISDRIVDVMMLYAAQCFPLYWYSFPVQGRLEGLVDEGGQLIRHDGVTDYILGSARRLYGASVSKDDVFYYVYGFLHLPKYREQFANELRKSLPKLFLVPRAKDFWTLSGAGRELAELHLNYETQAAPSEVIVTGLERKDYRVSKMRLSKDRRRLEYNGSIVIENIPARSFEYVVNGRSPLEWVIDRYQKKIDKASGLRNDPNLWCDEHDDPDYILRLILSVLTVSVRTTEIVSGLPEIGFGV